MEFIELDEEMEMPCKCQHCGDWFDLNDGYGSTKWYPSVVICEKCKEEEDAEIEQDEEVAELRDTMSDAEYTLAEGRKRLKELGVGWLTPNGLPETLEQLFPAFSQALLEKALRAREKYGFPEDGWKQPGWEQTLAKELLEHVHKGDPRDVAVYAAFAWYHGWSITPPVQVYDAFPVLADAYERGWKASAEGFNAEVSFDHAQDVTWLAKRNEALQQIIDSAVQLSPVPKETTEPSGVVAIRSYEFEGGLLHLELDAVRKTSDEEIKELYGQGKGKLLVVSEGEMSARQFYALGEFRDM